MCRMSSKLKHFCPFFVVFCVYFLIGTGSAIEFESGFYGAGVSSDGRGWPSFVANAVSENDINSNFLEYSDVDSGAGLPPRNVDDFVVGQIEIQNPGKEGLGKDSENGAAAVEVVEEIDTALPGTRVTDEFDPETMFQDTEYDSECSNFPNQTMIKPHFFSCNSPVRPPILVVHDSAVANSTGDYKFPLDFTQTVRFFFDVTSFATRRYDNLRAEVYLYRRKSGWLGCGWLFLPTFGIIDNYDVCDDNLSCPIYPGRQVIEVTINPTVAFSGIFKMIHNQHLPYQMIIRLVNNRAPTEELMCVVYQSKVSF